MSLRYASILMCSAVRLCDCSDGVPRRQRLKSDGVVLRCCWCGITRSSRFRLAASCRNLQLVEASEFAVPESEIVCARCARRAYRLPQVRRIVVQSCTNRGAGDNGLQLDFIARFSPPSMRLLYDRS
jgi:hypothetical protein